MKLKVGIIVVHYSNEKDTLELLKCLDKQRGINKQVYVVDNNVDNPLKKHILHKHKVVLLPTSKNLGWAGGADYGAKVAISDGCEYLCFLTNDTVIDDPYFVSRLVLSLKNKKIGATVPVVVYHSNPKLVWSSGGTLYMPFVYTRMNDNGIHIRKSKLKKNPDFGGIGLTLSANFYNDIGGWDSDYFLYYEDVDICFKINKIKPILLVKNAIIRHKVSTPSTETHEKLTPFSAFYYGRGVYVFIHKNVKKPLKAISVLSQIFFNSPLFVLSMIKQLNFKALIAFLRGTLVGLAILRKKSFL